MLMFTGVQAQNITLEISEFMAANGNYIKDEFDESDDWIEIFNYGNEAVGLEGLFISDNINNLKKFEFRANLSVQPSSYLILWADGQPHQGSQHLGFKISEGERIVISDGTNVIDELEIYDQRIDVSNGKTSGGTELCYFKNPSPGAENISECFGNLKPVTINQSTGNYNQPISVNLSHSESVELYYSLDGSIPNTQSITYDNKPIEISTNTTLRAMAVKEGYIDSDVKTQTYTFNESNAIPVLYVTSNGNKIDGGSNVPIHLELVDLNVAQIFSENVSSRLHGKIDQLSFKVFFGAKHGGGKIDKPLFSDKPEVENFESLVFRQAGNDDLSSSNSRRSHMRDGFLSTIVNRGDFNFKASGFEQVSVYLDAKYYGIFNMRERIDRSFIDNNYNVDDTTSKCIIEYKFGVPSNINEIEGKWDYFGDVLWGKCFDKDLSDNQEYASAIEYLNVEDFTDYWIHEVYTGNFDWLTNNVYFWAPVEKGGKFRWIMWDVDVGLGMNGKPDWNSLEWATSSEPGRPFDGRRTAIIRGLLTNDNYQEYFITRFCDLLNTEYRPNQTIGLLNELAANIRNEIPRHTERWQRGSLETWEKELERIRSYVTDRPKHLKEHINVKFEDVDDLYSLNLRTSIPGAGYFDVNTIQLSNENIPWSAQYFNNLPLNITVYANEGYKFVGWQHSSDDSTTTTLFPNSDTTVIAIFETVPQSEYEVIINEISYKQIEDYKSGDWVELYNNSNQTIDLSDWTFMDDSDNNKPFVFPQNSFIEPNGFILVTKDKGKFASVYPNVESVIGDLDFGLNKNEDKLMLYDENDSLVDMVNYTSDSPWPESISTNSIELIDANIDNNMGTAWQSSEKIIGSPGNDNVSITSNVSNINTNVLQIFPNPTFDFINVKSKAKGDLNLYSITGELLKTIKVINEEVKVDLSTYSNGSYILILVKNDGDKISKSFQKL